MKQQCNKCNADLSSHPEVLKMKNIQDPTKIYAAVECTECSTPSIIYDLDKLEDQLKDRKVRHLRGYHNTGGVTLLYKHIRDNIYRITWAICSPEDNYSRKTGVEICEERWNSRYLMLDITPGLAVDSNKVGFNFTVEHSIIVSLFAVLIGKRLNRDIQSSTMTNDAPLIHSSLKASIKENAGNDDFHEWKLKRLMNMVKWNYVREF